MAAGMHAGSITHLARYCGCMYGSEWETAAAGGESSPADGWRAG